MCPIYSFCYVEVEDVPPKYESLLGITKMKKAVEKSPNKAGGACKVFEILTGSGNSYIYIFSVWICRSRLACMHTRNMEHEGGVLVYYYVYSRSLCLT